MSAAIVARSESSFTVQVEIPYGSSMLDFEQAIQDRLNQAGVVATQECPFTVVVPPLQGLYNRTP